MTVSLEASGVESGQKFKYEVQYKPFRILQFIDDKLAMIINDADTLRYASPKAPHNTYMIEEDEIITGYEVGVGFTLSADKVFGIPQRA